MLRFIGRRVAFILTIWVLIVFFSHLGMRMLPNSEVSKPDFDVVRHGKAAWRDTRTYLAGALKWEKPTHTM